MAKETLLRVKDLVDNPTPRVPICLCLDTSYTMTALEGDVQRIGGTFFRDGTQWCYATGGTTRISFLNDGVKQFFGAIRSDDEARYSAEICIVTFDDDARCLLDFDSIDRQMKRELKIEVNEESDLTSMGEGVNLALDLLEKRKEEYKSRGVDYYQPWLVLMTDGEPNGDAGELDRAINRTVQLVEGKKLTVLPVCIGDNADATTVNKFSPNHPAMNLQGADFQKFFTFLSQSASYVSRSTPGEPIDVFDNVTEDDLKDFSSGLD